MRILAFSDVVKWWKEYKMLVDRLQPDIVALAGDLVSDGYAQFHCKRTRGDKIPKRDDFERLKKLHVNGFYHFLAYASRKSKVILVRGNHDDDFEGDYLPQKINKVPGCVEISGKIIELDGYSFLGLGYNDSRNRRKLEQMIKELTGKLDVVLMHGENIHLVSLLKPKVIIKGGWGLGYTLINDVPSVFTGPQGCAIVEFKNEAISKISGYIFNSTNNRITITHRAWLERLELEPGEVKEVNLPHISWKPRREVRQASRRAP